jgi:1-acyl-sn-glycerol-3-phosphate acyltransferase
MLVANHSAGIAIAELASFATLWTSGEVSALPLAGFAHPVGFRSAPGRWVHRHAGSAPSTYGAAHEALRSGVSLLVFPGGDHECLRPLSRAHEVDFAGRTGFLRIARDSGVPIIPMGIRNSHFTVPIAGRSRLLARLLVLPGLLYGVKNWTISVNSVIGAAAISLLPWPVWARVAAAWLWLSSPFIFVPVVPATIRFSIGPPLEPVDLFGEDRQRPLGDALADVTARVQQQVDAGASRRSRRQA